jgi:hypothetical protein
MRKGERAAADELIRRCGERLERIAHAMLRTYPRVAAHEETGDVVQDASLSLLAALREVDVGDTAAFFGLAAEHVRRRLLDLARKHRAREARAAEDHDADMERWADFHETVGELPADLFEQVPALLGGERLDQLLLGRGQDTVQAASISPCVLMATSNVLGPEQPKGQDSRRKPRIYLPSPPRPVQ